MIQDNSENMYMMNEYQNYHVQNNHRNQMNMKMNMGEYDGVMHGNMNMTNNNINNKVIISISKSNLLQESSNLPYQNRLTTIIDNEKMMRSLEMELEVSRMKKEMLNSILENKRKQLDSLKNDLKKIKISNDKMKDQINILSRENDFLHEMIIFSSKIKEN